VSTGKLFQMLTTRSVKNKEHVKEQYKKEQLQNGDKRRCRCSKT